MEMRWVFRVLILAVVLTFLAAPGGQAGMDKPSALGKVGKKFAPGEVLVKFKGTTALEHAGGKASMEETIGGLPASAQQALAAIQATPVRVNRLTGALKVRLPDPTRMPQAIDALYRSGTVEYAEPNILIRTSALPNDPNFTKQWSLNNTGQTGGTVDADIDATEAWNIRKDASATIVVVLDTGINLAHRDLKLNLWINPNETPGDGVDNDANGYIDDIYGINTYEGTSDPTDDNGHGSHVAGIIGARGSNSVGIAGVGWVAKMMAVKCMDDEGWGWIGDVLEGLAYASSIKTANAYTRMVIITSWETSIFSKALYDAISALKDQGVLVVAPAGNYGQDLNSVPRYPACYDLPNIISVGASDHNDAPWNLSNYGYKTVDLFAPGVDIFSTWLANAYRLYSGTSAAAAHVAGACALVWAKYPAYTWDAIKGLILNGAEDGVHPWGGKPFNQSCITEGRLNLYRSIYAANTDDPYLRSMTPTIAERGAHVTISGYRLGTAGEIKFGDDYIFPDSAIISWAPDKIVIKIPDDCPQEWRRVTVATDKGVSRGACCAVGVNFVPEAITATILGHSRAAHAQVGNDFWIISGINDWGQTALVEKLSLETLQTVFDPAWMIPKPVTNAGSAAIGAKIYVVGGIDRVSNKWSNKLLIFDTVTGTWSRGRNLPRYLCAPTASAYNGKLYVMGGQDPNNTVTRTNFVYDPATNTWASNPLLAFNTAAAAAAFVSPSKLWLMGGYTLDNNGNAVAHNLVQEFDFSDNSWSSADTLTRPRYGAAGIDYQNIPFSLGGSDEWYATGEFFDGGVWKDRIRDLQTVYYPMAGKLDNKIFLINGEIPWNNVQHTVWRFTCPVQPAP